MAAPLHRLVKEASLLLSSSEEPAEARLALQLVVNLLLPHSPPSLPPPPYTAASTSALRCHAEVWQASEGSEAREDVRKTFVRSHYAAWAKLMLSPLVRGWIAAFTHEERVTLVDSIFLAAPAREAMEALADGLEEAADPPSDDSPRHRASFCAALLNRMVRSRRLEALFAELPNSWERSSRGAEETEAEALVSLIMAIPPRLANLLRAAPPSELGAEQWYCAVFEQLFCVLLPPRNLSPAEEAGAHEDPSLLELLAARLLARIARVGHFGAIFPLLMGCRRSPTLLARAPPFAPSS